MMALYVVLLVIASILTTVILSMGANGLLAGFGAIVFYVLLFLALVAIVGSTLTRR